MGKFIDLKEQRFGRWTAIKRSYPNRKKQPMWLCKCGCGTERIVQGDNLRNGTSQSCGCQQREAIKRIGKENKITIGLASMRGTMGNYKRSAKKRGYNFELTEEQFAEITQKACYYCGEKPNNMNRNYHSNGDYIYNGLDRLDNKKGYTMDNVVPCCKICNYAKHDLTLQEFKDWIERVYKKTFEARG